jgi:hypothetical protein
MSKLFITGDTHGSVDAARLSCKSYPGFKETTREDILAIAGDFGFWFDNTKESLWWRNWIKIHKCIIVFVDGNHENFPLMEAESSDAVFGGGVASQLADNIFWLRRGRVYNLNGYKTFTFGGAESVDKDWRIEGVSWWREELPGMGDFNRGWENLEAHNWEVDLVLTHTAPTRVMEALYNGTGLYARTNYARKYNDPTGVMLQEFYEKLKFQSWWFGHHHIDCKFEFDNRFWAVYQQVYQLPERNK